MSLQPHHAGDYRIVNVAFPNQAADLVDGNILGTISSYTKQNGNKNQIWKFHSLEEEHTLDTKSNKGRISIESTAAPDSYANTSVEANGAPIIGLKQPKIWYHRVVDGDVYRILTADEKFVWTLEHPNNYYTILLRPAETNLGPKSQWKLEKV